MVVINDNVGSDMLEGWKNELAGAINDLKKAEADTLKRQTTYANATQWAAKLKAWEDSLLQTADLTESLESELLIFKTQISSVSCNTYHIVNAIDILYCEVKKVFYDAPPSDPPKPDVETLSQIIRGWQEAVYCLGNPPNLNKNGGFLKKVTELETKIKVVEDMREDILKKLIGLVQSVNLMETAICDNTDGLQGIVNTLQAEFAPGGNTDDESKDPLDPLSMPTNCRCLKEGHSCDSELTPSINFPLRCDPFVTGIIAKHAASIKEKQTATTKYDSSRQTRDRLLARKNGLEKAIAAATAAKK